MTTFFDDPNDKPVNDKPTNDLPPVTPDYDRLSYKGGDSTKLDSE